jgi:hypothetical protein
VAEIIDDIVEMITEAWTDADEAAIDDDQGAGFFVEETELASPSSGGVTKVHTTTDPPSIPHTTHTTHHTHTCRCACGGSSENR